MATVFVPLGPAEALQLRAGGPMQVRTACAVTPGLLAALGPDSSSDEAEFAALSYAGALALTLASTGPRLVVAADVEPDQLNDPGGPVGKVTVAQMRWAQVRALFADEAAAAEPVAEARRSAAGLPLPAALESAAVTRVVADFDLLWYAPDELGRLV